MEGFQPLVIHVHVYILADKYDIPPLQNLAISKFKLAVNSEWKTEAFAEAIRLVYGRIIATDDPLRDVVVDFASKHTANLLRHNVAFKTMMEDVGEFGRDLAMKLSERLVSRPGERRYKCPECQTEFQTAMPASRRMNHYCCPCCNKRHYGCIWNSQYTIS